MKEMQSLAVKTRTGTGKGANRRLRAEGMVPGVYYDDTGANIMVQVEHLPLQKLYSKTSSSHVFNLKIETESGEEVKPSLVWQVENHPTKARFLHVDFYGVDINKTIHVHIPVEVVGKARGQVQGGVVEVHRDTIEVASLPMSIPDKIVIDITKLELNESVQVADLSLPTGVTAIHEDNFAVLSIVLPQAAPEEEETAEAAPEGEAAAGEEPAA